MNIIVWISPLFPFEKWVWQSRVALADYISPPWGRNNHVSPRGIWPEKHTPTLKYRYFTVLLHCKYYIVNIFPFCKMGVIIPIGRDGLCETSKRHQPSRNSIGHWTHENSIGHQPSTMLHDPFWVPEGLQNCLKKSGQKTVRAREFPREWIRSLRGGYCSARVIMPRELQ